MRKRNPHEFLWDDAAIARLTALWLAGYSSGECARRLGVSRSSAIGKLNRLGLLRNNHRPLMPRMPARLLLKSNEQVSKPPQMPQKRRTKRRVTDFVTQPPPPPPPLPPIGSFGLLDLRNGHCRWPGPQDRAPWTFCGARQTHDSSYCAEHHAMAHSRASQRDYDRLAEQALAGKLFASRAGVDDAA